MHFPFISNFVFKKIRVFAFSYLKLFASLLLCELCVKQKIFVPSRLRALVLKNNSRREFIKKVGSIFHLLATLFLKKFVSSHLRVSNSLRPCSFASFA
jgi:hypothetical protein